MTDDPRISALAPFAAAGQITAGYGDHYLFFAGEDDIHSILDTLLRTETIGFKANMYDYDDTQLNGDILALMGDPNVAVQLTLDRSQTQQRSESRILTTDTRTDPRFFNSVTIGSSPTGDLSHTKGGVFLGHGIAFEGSTNWSTAGEGIGVSVNPAVSNPVGFHAENNTFLVSTNPVLIDRFESRLDLEHQAALRTRP